MITGDVYGISGAARPWHSIDAKKPIRKIHTCDKQDRIDKCLGCTAPDCSNCYSQPAKARKKKLHGEDKI